jgi:hypothetical protein
MILALVAVLLQAPACGPHCGTERWSVKTLTDADTGQIAPSPVATTVAALRAIHAPPRDSLPEGGRYGTVERTLYALRAIVLGWKVEADSDLHIVIADSAAPMATMIVEVPNPHCGSVCSSPEAGAIAAARAAVVAALGRPSKRFKRLARPRPVILLGVGFLDFIHGQTGVAPNGVELHPVLHVDFP